MTEQELEIGEDELINTEDILGNNAVEEAEDESPVNEDAEDGHETKNDQPSETVLVIAS